MNESQPFEVPAAYSTLPGLDLLVPAEELESRALDWSLSGRLLPADDALAGGLLREVCAPGELLARAHAIAHELVDASAPVSVALTRQMMWRALGVAHPMEAHHIESQAIAARGASADAREGVAAFLEKRAPQFPGRVSADMPAFYPWWDEAALPHLNRIHRIPSARPMDTTAHTRTGPLTGLKIVEFGAIGPAPFCAQLLADFGADIVRIERSERAGEVPGALSRGRRSIALDLKDPASIEVCGGGSLYLGLGLLAGVLHARETGLGQVVDCSMVEGSASLMSLLFGIHASGRRGARGSNLLDGGAHFYNPLQCSDGKWISIGAIEPQFYALLLDKLGLRETVGTASQNDRTQWPELKQKFEALIATRTRDEWCALLEGSDACFAPVLDLSEAPKHPHNVARGSFVEVDGQQVPGVAPRFSATPGRLTKAPPMIGADTRSALADWGIAAQRIESLLRCTAPLRRARGSS